jgi:hypothetical protein
MAKFIENQNFIIIKQIINNIGYSLLIIPYLIGKYRSKIPNYIEKNNNYINDEKYTVFGRINTTETINYNSNNNSESDELISKKKKYFCFLIIYIVSLLTEIINSAIKYSSNLENDYYIGNIFPMFSLLYIPIIVLVIFNKKLFNHQIVSVFLIIILNMIVEIIFLSSSEYLGKSFFISILFDLAKNFFKYVNIIIIFWLTNIKYVSIYFTLFITGIIGLFNDIILLIIFTNVPCSSTTLCVNEYNGKKYFDNFLLFLDEVDQIEQKSTEITFLVAYIICFGISQIIFYYLIYISYLNYLFLETVKNLCILFSFLYAFISYNNSKAIIVIILIFLFSEIFFSFVFNEIIELNFCKLNYNTKQSIAQRSIAEQIDNEKFLSLSEIEIEIY